MGGWSGGVYSRFRNWVTDKANSINPQAALFDQEDDGFAAGLNNCVTKDGLNKPSAAMDFNGQALTGVNNFAAASGKFTISVNGNVVSVPSSGIALTATAGGSTGAFTFNDNAGNNIGNFNSTAAGGGFVQFQRGGTTKAFMGDASQLVSGGALDDFAIRSNGNEFGVAFSGSGYKFLVDVTAGASAVDDGGTLQTIGWRDLPVNARNISYTFALSDRGKLVAFNGVGGQTYTIPANASVAFPIGTTIAISNVSGVNLSLAITTDTLFWDGVGSVGTRTISSPSRASITKVTATQWIVGGAGVS